MSGSEPESMWLWLSMKPGNTSRPPASITFAFDETRPSASPSAPPIRFVALNRDGLGPRAILFYGVDSRIADQQIRLFLYRKCLIARSSPPKTRSFE